MKLNLKTIILLSSAAAAALNVGQFFATYQQREAAFVAPALAEATTAPNKPTVPDAKLSSARTNPATPVTAQPPTPPAPQTAPPNPDAATIASGLSAAGLKPNYAALYLSVQQQTGTPWQLLAAVHEVETGQSGSTSRTSYAGATGPMQFLPSTFRHYSNGDITNLNDAVLAAGRYLAAGGAAHGDYSNALYHYNHSWGYVNLVLNLADRLGL
jgi:membrane-bound lytic murein transglycosylase B